MTYTSLVYIKTHIIHTHPRYSLAFMHRYIGRLFALYAFIALIFTIPQNYDPSILFHITSDTLKSTCLKVTVYNICRETSAQHIT